MSEFLYTLVLLYSIVIGIIFFIHGTFRLIRQSDNIIGGMEALTGVVMILGLITLQLKGLTTLPNQYANAGSMGKILLTLSVPGALLSVDYLLNRFWPLLNRLLNEEPDDNVSQSRRSVAGLTMGAVAALLLGGSTLLDSQVQSDASPQDQTKTSSQIQPTESSDFRLQAAFETPEQPTAAAFGDQEYGYITNLGGSVFKFRRPSGPDDSLQFEEVASGINFPQGVEVLNGTLYTVDLGDVSAGASTEVRIENLRNSNGKVIAFDTESDGSLRNRRTIISNLPVANRMHSPNGITAGPDGRLYLSIGHMGLHPEITNNGEYQPNPDLHSNFEYSGTVVSFTPDGSDLKIMAHGLRNVYDIAFNQDGDLFGADNDGPTFRSKQWDTLYHIVEDGYYGFPEYGTLDDVAAGEKIQNPMWIFDGWPTGIETTDDTGYQNGVLVGLRQEVVFVPVTKDRQGPYIPGRNPEQSVITMESVPTIVDADPEGLLYVGSLRGNELAVFEVQS